MQKAVLKVKNILQFFSVNLCEMNSYTENHSAFTEVRRDFVRTSGFIVRLIHLRVPLRRTRGRGLFESRVLRWGLIPFIKNNNR